MPPCGLLTCALLAHLWYLSSSDCWQYYSTLSLQNDYSGPRSPKPPCFCFIFCRVCPRPAPISFPLEEYVCSSIVWELSRQLTNQWMTVSNTGTCLYGLDSHWMPQPVHQLCRMEQERSQLGACVVWHLWGFLLFCIVIMAFWLPSSRSCSYHGRIVGGHPSFSTLYSATSIPSNVSAIDGFI
jgi:hypothetical protein